MIDFEYKVDERSTNNMTITGDKESLYVTQMMFEHWELIKVHPQTQTLTYYWKRNKLIV